MSKIEQFAKVKAEIKKLKAEAEELQPEAEAELSTLEDKKVRTEYGLVFMKKNATWTFPSFITEQEDKLKKAKEEAKEKHLAREKISYGISVR